MKTNIRTLSESLKLVCYTHKQAADPIKFGIPKIIFRRGDDIIYIYLINIHFYRISMYCYA